jgi:hypothetical protein
VGSLCGLEHPYDDRRCILPAGHEYAPAWTPHQSADGFRWDRLDEYYTAEDGQVYHDYVDEPVDYEPAEPGTYSQVTLLDEAGILTYEHTFSPPVVLKADSSVEVTWSITIS